MVDLREKSNVELLSTMPDTLGVHLRALAARERLREVCATSLLARYDAQKAGQKFKTVTREIQLLVRRPR